MRASLLFAICAIGMIAMVHSMPIADELDEGPYAEGIMIGGGDIPLVKIDNTTWAPIIDINAGSGLRVTFLQTGMHHDAILLRLLVIMTCLCMSSYIGLQKLMDILLTIINTNFRELSIPDQHMDENVPVIGKIHLDITNIKIHQFRIPHGKAGSGAPSNFNLELGPGIGLLIQANWHWRKVHWPHLSGHGSVDITPENGDISTAMQITPSAGHFHVTAVTSHCNFDKFKIKVCTYTA